MLDKALWWNYQFFRKLILFNYFHIVLIILYFKEIFKNYSNISLWGGGGGCCGMLYRYNKGKWGGGDWMKIGERGESTNWRGGRGKMGMWSRGDRCVGGESNLKNVGGGFRKISTLLSSSLNLYCGALKPCTLYYYHKPHMLLCGSKIRKITMHRRCL